MYLLVAFSSFIITITAAAISSTNKNDILNTHNSIRKLHGNTAALRWSDTLAAKSQSYVESCKYKNADLTMKFYEEYLIIDNVASGFSDWSSVIEAWYAGEKNYDYDHPGYTRESGSYITMVWKDTTEIGCSSFNCSGENAILYQCLYSPGIPERSLFDEKEYKSNVHPRAS